MSPKNQQLARRAAIREGEGCIIDVTRRNRDDAAGTIEVALDLSCVPVPSRSYSADAASVDYADEVVRIMFAQKQIAGGKLRSLLVISMSVEDAERFLVNCKDLRPTLDGFLNAAGLAKPALLTITEEPQEQTVTLEAAIVNASFSSKRANFDFYYLSPRMMVEFARDKFDKIAIDPVVRVMLRTSLLASIVDGIEEACKAGGAVQVHHG